jgi:type III pantothenate kinase
MPDRAIGTNTADSMRSGAVLGAVAQLDGLLDRFRAELRERGEADPIPAIATGGMASILAKHVAGIDEIDHHLTLRGLQIVAQTVGDA